MANRSEPGVTSPDTQDPVPRGRSLNLGTAATVGLWLIVITTPLVAQLSGRYAEHFTANADHLLLVELFDDLDRGGRLAEWYLPYASYYIPDWPIYWLVRQFSGDVRVQVGLFGVVQSAIVLAAAAGLARQLGTPRWGATMGAAGALVMLLSVNNLRPFVYLGAMFIHTGTTAMAGIALWLMVVAARSGRLSTPAVWASALLCSATVASDRIFAVWFLVPATIALLVWGGQHHRRFVIGWAGVHAIGALIALQAVKLVPSSDSTYDLSVGRAGVSLAGLKRLKEIPWEVAEDGPWALPITGLALLLSQYAFVRGKTLFGSERLDPDGSRLMAVFIPASIMSTLVAQALLTGSVGPSARYNTPAFLLAVLSLGLVWGSLRKPAALALASLPVIGLVAWWVGAIGDINTNKPPGIECVEEYFDSSPSRRGIAGYWDSRQLEVYTDDPVIEVAAYGPRVEPELLNVSGRQFDGTYDFVIDGARFPVFQPDPNVVRGLFGEPLRTAECPNYTILDYGPGNIDPNPFRDPGTSRSWLACELQSQVGHSEPDCAMSFDDATDDTGYMVFGPYVRVPPGTYEVVLDYRAADPGAGAWDVVAGVGLTPGVSIHSDEVPTGDGSVTTVVEIGPDPNGRAQQLETRVFATDAGDLDVRSVTITRLQ